MIYSALATDIVDFGGSKSNPRGDTPVTKITIHHMAGQDCALSHRDSSVQSSANYYIGSSGDICAGISEDRRAWTSSSRDNDFSAITIEVSNDSGAPSWTVSDEAYDALISLCADICERYGINPHFDGTPQGTLTVHKMFTSTECCGAYLWGKHSDGSIERDIKARMGQKIEPQPAGELYRVQVGAYKTRAYAERLKLKLENAGMQTYLAVTQGDILRVQVGAFRKKENAEALLEKVRGLGFSDAFITTNPNVSALKDTKTGKKSLDEIALEVIRGEWGNGANRSRRLREAGYNAEEVQARVNELMDR